MPMPKFLPDVEPNIPDGLVFIALTMVDSNEPVAIMHFPTIRRNQGDMPFYRYPATPENIELEIARANFNVASWRVIRYDEIPKDRTYRNAWADNGTKLHHDMGKARHIHKEHLRIARLAKLADLDVAYQKADEVGDKDEKVRVAQAKQALRDITKHPSIDAAQTVEDLKQIWVE